MADTPATQAAPALLTDARIDEIMTPLTRGVPYSWRAFARAIEREVRAALEQPAQLDLHAKIMNLPCDASRIGSNINHRLSYKLGHKDARHAAAELVQRAQQPGPTGAPSLLIQAADTIERLLREGEFACEDYGTVGTDEARPVSHEPGNTCGVCDARKLARDLRAAKTGPTGAPLQQQLTEMSEFANRQGDELRRLREDVLSGFRIANELTLETQTVEEMAADLVRQVREARAALATEKKLHDTSLYELNRQASMHREQLAVRAAQPGPTGASTPLTGTPRREQYVAAARVYARAYGLHEDAPGYLPRTQAAADVFEPHAWVIAAMQQAYSDGRADGHADGIDFSKAAAQRLAAAPGGAGESIPAGYVLHPACVQMLLDRAREYGQDRVTFGVMQPGVGFGGLPEYSAVVSESVERLEAALAGATGASTLQVDEARLGQLWHEWGEPLEWPQFLGLAQTLAAAPGGAGEPK